MLNDSIEVFEMFPDELTDAWVLWDCVENAVWSNIACLGSLDRNVVDVQNRNVRYFWLEDKGDIVVEDWY